ncbi:transcriptional regulator [Geodermatophilus tzadiensis]|uniref:Transcriptional regulator n=1 Tax=Geodermatophilus tzadiensis TaxID=1137988 RepID=A0A2T0TPM5_9ACTN|nr:sugar-binding domain-containing protein [Geodermatophilus tzadiensis]PRY47603.1 transcriptional regulator [Geodermatophilus tzadiensis]
MTPDDRIERVARRFWLDRATMETIANEEGVSRSTISRALDTARATGVVSITVNPVHGRAAAMATELGRRHGIAARVVPVPEDASGPARLQAVAAETAVLLDEVVDSGTTLGLAWGTTTSAVGQHLRARPLRDAHVVQLNGAMNTHSSGVGYGSDVLGRFGTAWDARVHHFPVPAFFDRPETRQAMWRERSVRRVLDLQQGAGVALFGIGAMTGAVPSRVHTEGYLTPGDRADLVAAGAVGDVCTVFLRADGSWEGIALNARTSGLLPPLLRRIPRRVCAVAGDDKVAGLVAALAAGLVTDLVLDSRAAQELLTSRPPTRPGALWRPPSGHPSPTGASVRGT